MYSYFTFLCDIEVKKKRDIFNNIDCDKRDLQIGKKNGFPQRR